jgi:hypothetical protein
MYTASCVKAPRARSGSPPSHPLATSFKSSAKAREPTKTLLTVRPQHYDPGLTIADMLSSRMSRAVSESTDFCHICL